LTEIPDEWQSVRVLTRLVFAYMIILDFDLRLQTLLQPTRQRCKRRLSLKPDPNINKAMAAMIKRDQTIKERNCNS